MKKSIITLLTIAVMTSVSFAGIFDGSTSDLKVKGLYIGMPMEEALVASKSAVQGTSVSNWAEQMKIEKFGDGTSNIVIKNAFGMPLFIVLADSSQKVITYAFEWPAVNAIFNSGDMSMKEFAQLFIDSYNIPNLEPDEKGENLVHTLPSGVKVMITGDKGVVVQKTQTQSERKASFN
ncbi:MAG: hypothetical protein RL728_768 [Bacteroidota bacterium]|jgi:hypothetical protein